MAASKINHKKKACAQEELPLHMMLIPGIIFTFIFLLYPYGRHGNCISEFIPAKGAVRDQEMDWPR